MRQALKLTPIEIRKAGWEALRKSLDVTVDDLIKNIKTERLAP